MVNQLANMFFLLIKTWFLSHQRLKRVLQKCVRKKMRFEVLLNREIASDNPKCALLILHFIVCCASSASNYGVACGRELEVVVHRYAYQISKHFGGPGFAMDLLNVSGPP